LLNFPVHGGLPIRGFHSQTILAGILDVCNGSMKPAIQGGLFAIRQAATNISAFHEGQPIKHQMFVAVHKPV
jgi:hypothetical protein